MAYEPREDSLLLQNAVRRFASGEFLDMGAGSGIQGITAAKKEGITKVVCADKNKNALSIARQNAEREGVAGNMVFVESDLFSNIEEKFDCIAFNPPYLSGERFDDLDGGPTGREVTDCFLDAFGAHLKQGGCLLLLQSSASDSGETLKKLESLGYSVDKVASERKFFEELFVLRAIK
jgi:release factor glutamine methyltransferase